MKIASMILVAVLVFNPFFSSKDFLSGKDNHLFRRVNSAQEVHQKPMPVTDMHITMIVDMFELEKTADRIQLKLFPQLCIYEDIRYTNRYILAAGIVLSIFSEVSEYAELDVQSRLKDYTVSCLVDLHPNEIRLVLKDVSGMVDKAADEFSREHPDVFSRILDIVKNDKIIVP